MKKLFNRLRVIKRKRRSKVKIEAIKTGLFEILYEDNPQTVPGVFYQAVGRNLVGNTEAEYKGTIIRLLNDMRKDGTIPFNWSIGFSR